MKSDPRLNWHFESSSRYSGLSRCVPSSSHRLPRSSGRELGLFVSSPTSSSRRLPRSSRRDQTCRHRVRLVDSSDRLITHHSFSTRQVQSSSRRTLGSTRRELLGRDWDRSDHTKYRRVAEVFGRVFVLTEIFIKGGY